MADVELRESAPYHEHHIRHSVEPDSVRNPAKKSVTKFKNSQRAVVNRRSCKVVYVQNAAPSHAVPRAHTYIAESRAKTRSVLCPSGTQSGVPPFWPTGGAKWWALLAIRTQFVFNAKVVR